jgi:ABC-2 type transport system permease protein
MTGLLNSLGRIWAIFMKETVQIRRDRFTFAIMFGIPIMQLILFGYDL